MSQIKRIAPVYSQGSTRTVGLRYDLESGESHTYYLKDDPEHDEALLDWSQRLAVGSEFVPFTWGGEEAVSESVSQEELDQLADEVCALPVDSKQEHTYGPEIRKYILGGNALFTVVFGPVVGRRTFRVKSNKADRNSNWSTGNQDRSLYWVSLKIGPGNGFDDFVNIGRLEQDINGAYRFYPKRNRDGQHHFAASLFEALWNPLDTGGRINSAWQFFHASTCCVCGRTLTVPSSVESGVGPECEGKM